jgi:hypothetical protein
MNEEWILDREPGQTDQEYREAVEHSRRLFPGCKVRGEGTPEPNAVSLPDKSE